MNELNRKDRIADIVKITFQVQVNGNEEVDKLAWRDNSSALPATHPYLFYCTRRQTFNGRAACDYEICKFGGPKLRPIGLQVCWIAAM